MFACRDAIELLTEDQEGALSGWVRCRQRFHMAVCPHCKVVAAPDARGRRDGPQRRDAAGCPAGNGGSAPVAAFRAQKWRSRKVLQRPPRGETDRHPVVFTTVLALSLVSSAVLGVLHLLR